MHIGRVLTDIETARIAEAIWSQLDGAGLPKLTDTYFRSILLYLPEQRQGQAIEAIVKWLDALEIPPRFLIFDLLGGVIQPASYTLLDIVGRLIQRRILRPDSRQASQLADAVDQAASILAYSHDRSVLIARAVDPEELPHFRRRLATLIAAMVRYKMPIRSEAITWCEAARDDPFVDVRQAMNDAPNSEFDQQDMGDSFAHASGHS
jgi:hypothetical protein